MTRKGNAADCLPAASPTAPGLSGGAWSERRANTRREGKQTPPPPPPRDKGLRKNAITHKCSTVVVSTSLFCRNYETKCSSTSWQDSTTKTGEQRQNVNRKNTEFSADVPTILGRHWKDSGVFSGHTGGGIHLVMLVLLDVGQSRRLIISHSVMSCALGNRDFQHGRK